MRYVNLQDVRALRPCKDGWHKLLQSIGAKSTDHADVALTTILKSNGIADAIWCLRTLPTTEQRLFAADVAASSAHIYQEQFPDDPRIMDAITTAQDINATRRDLKAVSKVVYDAGEAAALNKETHAAAVAARAAYLASCPDSDCDDLSDAAQSAAISAYLDGGSKHDSFAAQWDTIEQIFIRRFG